MDILGKAPMPVKVASLLLLSLLFVLPVRAEGPVRIGVIQGLTGIASEDGTNALRAMQLAAGDLASEVELTVEDDATDAKNSVTAYQRLAGKGVKVIIGSTYGFTTEAVLPLAGRDGVVILNTTGIYEAFEARPARGNFFNNSISIEEDVRPFELFLDGRPSSSAVVIHTSSKWGRIQSERYRAALDSRKWSTLEVIEPVQQDNNDWGSVVARLRSLSPSLVLLLLNKNDIALLARRAREQHFTGQLFGSKNTADAFRLSTQPETLEGTCFSYADRRLAEDSEFIERFRQTYGEAPRIFADASYDAVLILNQALRTQRQSGGDLRSILQNETFRGRFGSYRFSPERSLTNARSSLVCISSGKLARVTQNAAGH